MVKTKFKKAVSLMLAAVMSLTAFMGIGATTAFAAVGEKADVYLVDYPRSGDTNNNGEWGHGNLNYMNGWKGLSTKYTGLRAMGSYSGNIAYCIEPGTGQRTGDTLTEKDENFFNNISPNGTISGDDIRLLIGRILQYGYRGGISTSWKSQNESDANCIAHAYATQILIWETIVGERDAGFNHVSTGGYNAVLECVSSAHPLRSKILSYYNSMVTSVQYHTKVPSFCTRSSGSAKVNELEWNGSKYVATLTDTNGVLGNYNFSANIDGVSFSVSGNKLTVSMEKAPSKEFTITAAKKNGVRRGVVVWSDGIHQNGNGIQDVVTYAQEVSDPVSGFVKMKVSYGSCQIVKTSEDGKVDGIQFTISGNGVNQTVTTANGGKFQLDNLMPGVYTVTEQSIDKYVPQEVHRVTVVAGQVAKVNFNNVLKRGNLQVIKSSEDNLVEGVTFHLYGTSLAGITVDEYAVTDKNGVASFDDVLISGTTPYTIEELTYAGQEVAVTETATSFVNERQKVTVSLEKAIEKNDIFNIGNGDEVKNISFGLFAAEELVSTSGTSIPADGLIEIISLSENGKATLKTDLPFGSYYVKELATDEHYILSDSKYPFTFSYAGQDTETVEIAVNDGKPIENKLIYGSVSGKKITENGEALGGAVIGLFKADETEFTKENALMTATSQKDGSFSFEKVPYGNWLVREIEQPEGFVLDETSYEVKISEVAQVIEVEIVNEYVHGNIKLTKVDEDYPDNKLTGATFEVYKDVNGDGKLDDGDELIGTLNETSTGIYEMKELLYGKYLVRETKAPEGFELDKGVYSVFIEKDETTYEVENKAGVGFINTAMKGNLKIVKTSSDGKVEGFTFRVTGVNGYDRSFTTDKNGEIVIEGLRIGDYTVSEVQDTVSASYVLPADKIATVKVGSTTVVEMHNELRDTPKTGDNSNVGLWTALAGLSALGIVGTAILAYRKKKKEDNE